MAYHTTILRQIIDLFPRHEFESIAKDYHRGQKFRSFNRWSQFLILFIGQVSGRRSLRDLVMNITAQAPKLYHLGIKKGSRATLARAMNASRQTCIKRCFTSSCRKPNSLHPSTDLNLIASSISLMQRWLTSVSRLFHGQPFGSQREQSSCTLALMETVIFPSLLILPEGKPLRLPGPERWIFPKVPWQSLILVYWLRLVFVAYGAWNQVCHSIKNKC